MGYRWFVFQSSRARLFIAFDPLVSRLSADTKATAKFGKWLVAFINLDDKSHALMHDSAFLPGHVQV